MIVIGAWVGLAVLCAARTECAPYQPGKSPLARRPPNGLPEELLEAGVLIGGVAVAGLDIDHARAFVSLGPGENIVALGIIRSQQRVAFPDDVEDRKSTRL